MREVSLVGLRPVLDMDRLVVNVGFGSAPLRRSIAIRDQSIPRAAPPYRVPGPRCGGLHVDIAIAISKLIVTRILLYLACTSRYATLRNLEN